MSYAVRNDGMGWRAVNGPDDVGPDETYSETQPELKPTADDLSASARTKRDALIAATDWMVLRAQETGKPVATEWLSYRKALRDVPAQKGFPSTITWPTAPEAT